MKKIIFSSIFFLVSYCKIDAQDMCRTIDTVADLLQQISPDEIQTPSSNYVVRIFIHIIRKSDGSDGQDASSVLTAKQTLVSQFEPLGICISVLGQDEIWDDTYYDQTVFNHDADGDGKFDNFHPNSHSDAVDIYFLGADALFQGGTAAKIPSTSLVVGGALFSTNLVASPVISHEFGHCLGLYHTNHGFANCDESGPCTKLVNLSNWSTCGDFVSDTQQDPSWGQATLACLWNGGTCSGVSDQDANGDYYIPDMHNIMVKYIAPYCFWYFTDGQGYRMKQIIANSSLLQAAIVPNSLTVSSLIVGSGDTKLYHVLNDLTMQTSVVVNGYGTLILRAGESINLEYNFSADYSSSLLAYIDNTCSTIDADNSARAHFTTNISEVTNTPAFSDFKAHIYPNPANKKVYIDVKSDKTRIHLQLASVSGIIMKKEDYSIVNRKSTLLELDISKLAIGVYFIIISDGRRIISHKLLKIN
jgi:hypothetical protein